MLPKTSYNTSRLGKLISTPQEMWTTSQINLKEDAVNYWKFISLKSKSHKTNISNMITLNWLSPRWLWQQSYEINNHTSFCLCLTLSSPRQNKCLKQRSDNLDCRKLFFTHLNCGFTTWARVWWLIRLHTAQGKINDTLFGNNDDVGHC